MSTPYDQVSQLISSVRASLAAFTQSTRLLRLHTPLGEGVLLAERLDGIESVGQSLTAAGDPVTGFRLEVTALSTDAQVVPQTLLGKPVLLELVTDQSLTLRSFHGHVTHFEQLGSNGGLARYRLIIEPWFAFLRMRRDSYVFQNKSVIDIAEDLFSDYAGQGSLLPAWRWQLADRSVYAPRSLCIQYNESDHDFVLRLLAEEGLFCWFEHEGSSSTAAVTNAGNDVGGRHTLVIGDSNDAFGSAASGMSGAALGPIRFHRASATEASDTVQRFRVRAAITPYTIELGSWDYVSQDLRPVAHSVEPNGAAPSLAWTDTPGLYRYADREHGARQAQRRLDSLNVPRWTIEGQSTVRYLAPGGHFELIDHPRYANALTAPESARFAVLEVEHHAHNNLSADFSSALDGLMGDAHLPKSGNGKTSRADDPLYQNRFKVLPIAVPYATVAPDDVDLLPQSLTPRRPRVPGSLTATVVGQSGTPIQTDRDHRIRVQFHFQRGGQASSRLDHPAGDDNAPGNDAAGTWVRVLTPVAGSNWGGHFVPRLGQEVIVEFLNGDIDRPVVTGSLYNGVGSEDAPGNSANQTAPAHTPNAPAWFAGNGHPPVFSGIKTMALGASQSGQGGYTHFLMDDTPCQSRAQLATTQHSTEVTLGHHRAHDNGGQGVAGNARTTGLGHGASMATDAYGAVRGGAGVLISADARAGGTFGGAQAMDASEARDQLNQAQSLTQSLIDTAKNQQADIPPTPAPATKNGAAASDPVVIAALKQTQADLQGAGGTGGLTWSAPHLIQSAPGGIAHVTPGPAIFSAGSQFHVTAGIGIEMLAQAAARYHVKNGIRIFAYGSKPVGDAPLKEQGLRFHAAAGQVSLQAQSDAANLAAQKDVRISSTTDAVSVQAAQHVLMTAKGAYLKIEGDTIQLHAPGKVTLKGGSKVFTGPQSATSVATALPKAKDFFDEQFVIVDETTSKPLPMTPYEITTAEGQTYAGITDTEGRTVRIYTKSPQTLTIKY